MTVSAQNLGGADGGRTLVLGCLHQRIGRAQAIGFAGMGEDADEVGARCDDPVGHLEQLGIVRLQSTAMVIAIQFDEHGRRHASGLAHVRQGIGLLHGIEQQLQIDAGAATKLHGADGRSPRHADRVGHVSKAVACEIFRLGDGRDRDRAGFAGEHVAGDVDALGRLHVRAQHHAKLAGVLGETLDVALEPPPVQKQRRGDEGVDRVSRFAPFHVRLHLSHILAPQPNDWFAKAYMRAGPSQTGRRPLTMAVAPPTRSRPKPSSQSPNPCSA